MLLRTKANLENSFTFLNRFMGALGPPGGGSGKPPDFTPARPLGRSKTRPTFVKQMIKRMFLFVTLFEFLCDFGPHVLVHFGTRLVQRGQDGPKKATKSLKGPKILNLQKP